MTQKKEGGDEESGIEGSHEVEVQTEENKE